VPAWIHSAPLVSYYMRANHRRSNQVHVILLSIAMLSQIGRYPVLAPIAGATGSCHAAPAAPDLASKALNRTFSLQLEGEPRRTFAVSTDARGGVSYFSASYATLAGATRRDGERVTATYDANGRLHSGRRSSFANGAEGPSAPLDAPDAVSALALARAIVARCAR
jgi:hypothetical protein